MSLKYCANLSFMFQEAKTLLDRYELAKKAGFTAVECAFPYEYSIHDLANVKKETGLRQVLINTYPGNLEHGELGFAAVCGKEVDFKKSINLALEYAKILDCKKIHILSGIIEQPKVENYDCYVSNLKYAAEVFEKENIVGLIEPINYYTVKNYYMNSFKLAIEIVQHINSPALKIQLDFFHLQLLKGDLTNWMKKLLPLVGHIQIAQVPSRHEPDTLGEINYHYVFQTLIDLGYTEWIGLEYKPATDTMSGLKWLNEYNKYFKCV